MRIPRFYCPIQLPTHGTLTLPDSTFRHAIQVLRLSVGESITLFNGEGGEYHATLEQISKKSASVHINAYNAGIPESDLHLTLAQAIIKPDKMDFALQKAVELGINAIQPLITDRSVVRLNKESSDKKHQHWQGIIIAACEQSGRTHIPTLHPTQSLDTWLKQKTDNTRIMLAIGEHARLTQQFTHTNGIEFIVGPEGGFTDTEEEQCQHAGVIPISLGKRILRAETASISMIALLQHQFGDL